MGMRAGEVCAVRFCDADLVTGQLTISHSYDTTPGRRPELKRPKNERARYGQMPTLLVEAIALEKERREQEAESAGLPFSEEEFICCYGDGSPYRPERLSEQFRKMADAAGFDKRLVFHGLRHTNQTVQDSKGEPRAVSMQRNGHSSVRISDHYTHALSTDDVKAAELLDADLRGL
jgi:integrase